jgi:site-specific DNA-adenine methylase
LRASRATASGTGRGGASFFDIGHRSKSRAISDISPELISVYEVVKTDVEGSIAELQNES